MEQAHAEGAASATGAGAQPTVAILIVGDEILSGRTRDENGPFLTGELARVGARVAKIVVIPDEVDLIAGEVRALAKAHDFVITTGGVGPTHDDMTPLAVGKAFDTPLEVNQEMKKFLAEGYGPQANEAVFRMARLPVGSEIITGQGITFPPFKFKNVVMLPGVPRYVQNKFPLISHLFAGKILHRREVLVPADETDIADLLAALAERNGDLKIGSYPMSQIDERGNRVEVTVTGVDNQRVEEGVRELLAMVPGSSRKDESGGAQRV